MIEAPKLSQLEPGFIFKTATQSKKQSSLNLGSFLQVLREPHRLPESARPFIVGDPVSLIDWKVFAKTDHLMVREIRPNSQVKVKVLIDCSKSMYWPNAEMNSTEIEKIETAIRAGFFLGYAHHRNGDSVEIVFLNFQNSSSRFSSFNPRNTNQIIAKFRELSRDSWLPQFSQKKLSDWSAVAESKKVDRLYFFTDGLAGIDRSFLPRSRQGIFFHTLSSLEKNIDWLGNSTCYFDNQAADKEFTGENLKTDSAYYSQLDHWTSGLKNSFKNYKFFPISESTTISSFLGELRDYAKSTNRQ